MILLIILAVHPRQEPQEPQEPQRNFAEKARGMDPLPKRSGKFPFRNFTFVRGYQRETSWRQIVGHSHLSVNNQLGSMTMERTPEITVHSSPP